MASASVMKLAKMAESGKRAVATIRRKAKERERYALSQGEIVIGGALGGVIDGTMGEGGADAELFGLPLVASVGALGVVVGFSSIPGAEHVGFTGAGLLSYAAGNMARAAVSE